MHQSMIYFKIIQVSFSGHAIDHYPEIMVQKIFSSHFFFLNDGKEYLFYGHYIFPTIFFHLFGTLQGNILDHNSVPAENSNDEPSLFKASLTLICHMQSPCVTLKIIFQFCTRTQNYHATHPNHWRDMPLQITSVGVGIQIDSRVQLLRVSVHSVCISNKNYCAFP